MADEVVKRTVPLTHVVNSTDHQHPIFEASFALAFVNRIPWKLCVSALVADVPAIYMGNHWAEFKTQHTIGAANDIPHFNLWWPRRRLDSSFGTPGNGSRHLLTENKSDLARRAPKR
jgi:hypothetical protein